MPIEAHMDLVERRFDELSRIGYRIFTCDISGERPASAMILRFVGSYGRGSAGNDDGQFMRTITLSALSLWMVDAVVFDLRELDYEWGNAIWGMYGHSIEPAGIGDLPYATVVSERCRAGLESCIRIAGPLFDDVETAIDDLRRRAQECLASLQIPV